MGSKDLKPKQENAGDSVSKKVEKKVLIHIVDPKLENINLSMKQEIYQIILDEVVKTDKFSLLMNHPSELRSAQIKFIEIHTKINKKISGSEEQIFTVALSLMDGNTGSTIVQEENKLLTEEKVRFYIRKTLRNIFFHDLENKKKNDPGLALIEDSLNEEEINSELGKNSDDLKSGSSFTPLFDPQRKKFNASSGENNKDKNSKYAADSYENLVPYTFRKKQPKESGEQIDDDEDKIPSASGILKFDDANSYRYQNSEKINLDKGQESKQFSENKLADEYFQISKAIGRKLQEYAEDPEKLKAIKETLGKNKSKDIKGDSVETSIDLGANVKSSDFNKSFRAPGETIYSVGVNFIVDKIESSDTIITTNNFKQVGIVAKMDKYIEGNRGEKISGEFMHAFPVDYDKQFDIPGSLRAGIKYHKAFNTFLLGVFGLDYERQFFVNLAEKGNSLQAWNNLLIWYTVGLDISFNLLERNISLSSYFSKPFVGNTDYGGDDKRTIDGYRIYGDIQLQIFRNISLKSEIFLSEMSGQGFSNLKNSHVTSATYLIYAF